jgi:predicted ArsR family transcriptional regulator
MVAQPDLFAYPGIPGVKTNDNTTLKAALQISARAQILRAKVYESLLESGPASADQIAGRLRETILTIRPRCSELRASGHIQDSGERAFNESGKMAIVWKAVDPRASST